MKLEDLGYRESFDAYRREQNLNCYEVGRVIEEHKERYLVCTPDKNYEAEITGNIRFAARNREDFPAVGDWVALITYEDGVALIHRIFPRFSMIRRSAIGQYGEIQLIATNIDYACIIQSVDRDFNVNRLERYLVICRSSAVKPIIVLSKADLIDSQKLTDLIEQMKHRIIDVPVIAISNETRCGYEELTALIKKGCTYCLLGSSGVGKSTLLNHLSGKTIMNTGTISQSTNRGKHVTTHRELILLDTGGVLIDNPGMRQVGIADAGTGLGMTFDEIAELSQHCKFRNCTHTDEPGCNVLRAVEKGELDAASYANYLKMVKESAYFNATQTERREKDRSFGKMLKNYKNELKKDRH